MQKVNKKINKTRITNWVNFASKLKKHTAYQTIRFYFEISKDITISILFI